MRKLSVFVGSFLFLSILAQTAFTDSGPNKNCVWDLIELNCLAANGGFMTCDPYTLNLCVSGGKKTCLEYSYYPPVPITVNCTTFPNYTSCVGGVGGVAAPQTYYAQYCTAN